MKADDMELLREFARDRSDGAFRQLVERHINLVHSVALRQTQDAHLADDVTQAVFIVLAEKAATIPPKTILAGWLFRATRFVAANLVRAEARREHWERKAAEMEPSDSTPHEFENAAPLLNEVLEELPEMDRTAILLRFFQSKSIEEVGCALGTSESAAKMRLSRAVEKLRQLFRRRGHAVPTATVLALLSAQASHAAPAGLVSSVTSAAILNPSNTATFILAKGTLKVMAQAKAKKLALAALALLFGGASAVIVQQAFFKTREAKAVAQDKSAVAAPGLAESTAKETGKVLVFRGRPSWNRQPDFEDALVEMGIDFEVKPADLMDTADLSRYRAIVIPGAQSTSQFYTKYIENAERFDAYVTNGGVLLLELNGSERAGLPLPRGVQMVLSPALENTITLPQHPVMLPLAGRIIRANYASHGYLTGVPTNALVLATETLDGESVPDRPTFAEYTSGKGRVLAACQCFHDRDNSGRGPLMQTALRYATEQNWYAPKK